jgi:hypothetical protein
LPKWMAKILEHWSRRSRGVWQRTNASLLALTTRN